VDPPQLQWPAVLLDRPRASVGMRVWLQLARKQGRMDLGTPLLPLGKPSSTPKKHGNKQRAWMPSEVKRFLASISLCLKLAILLLPIHIHPWIAALSFAWELEPAQLRHTLT